MLFFFESSSAAKSFADLLPWAALVAPGVVLNKDGSLMTGWRFRGPDLDSSTPEELEVLAAQTNRALLLLGNSWVLHCDAVRRPAEPYPDEASFPDPVTRAIDRERRSRYGALFETETTLILTFFPPRDAHSALKRLFINNAGQGLPPENVLEDFLRVVDDFQGALTSSLRLRRLDDESFLAHLHHCATGIDQPIAVPPDGLPLDQVLADQEFIAGLEPRVGARHLIPLALSGLPVATTPGMLDVLGRLPFAARFSVRFCPLEPHSAERLLDRHRRHWAQQRRGVWWLLKGAVPTSATREEGGEENLNAKAMLHDLTEARSEAAAGEIRFGLYTAVLVLTEEDRGASEQNAKAAMAAIRHTGITVRRETVNAVEAFLGTLPGHVAPNLRRPIIHTRNLTDLLPLTSIWSGRSLNPSPNQPPGNHPALLWTSSGNSAFRLNLHVGDVGHTLVVGPTGSGKSLLLSSFMAGWMRYPGSRVICFDKGYSALALTAAVGGAHYDIGGSTEKSLAFCPLGQLPTSRSERVWAEEWLEILMSLNGVEMTPDRRAALAEALDLLAQAGASRTLTDLYIKLQDPALRSALASYTVARADALLDAPADHLSTSRFMTFEMSHLLDERGRNVVVPTLLYLFHRLRNRLDGSPTLIVLDEAWTILDNPKFSDWLRLALKEYRKLNAAVVFATQSLADLSGSQLREVLLESTATKLFLPNPLAESPAAASHYGALGLNARQLRLIATARPKGDYFVASSEGRRLFEFVAGPLELSFCGAGSPEDLSTIRAFSAEHGSDWPSTWLRHRGLQALIPLLSTEGSTS